MRTEKQLTKRIRYIAGVVNDVKQKRIKRIVRQLNRMSPNDVQALERLIGKR